MSMEAGIEAQQQQANQAFLGTVIGAGATLGSAGIGGASKVAAAKAMPGATGGGGGAATLGNYGQQLTPPSMY
jgi:hypothetical protein